MYNYDEWSIPKLKKHYDELLCARKNGKLGVPGFAMLQDVEYWLSRTPEQREDYKRRINKGQEANERRDDFRNKFRIEVDKFVKLNNYIQPEDVGQIIGEYTPILQGEENQRYFVFPAPYADNFLEDTIPMVVVERLDPQLSYLDKTVVFEDRSVWVRPDFVKEYENFAIGGKVNGFYLPMNVGIIKTLGTGKFSNIWNITSTIEDEVILECLKQKGMR